MWGGVQPRVVVWNVLKGVQPRVVVMRARGVWGVLGAEGRVGGVERTRGARCLGRGVG